MFFDCFVKLCFLIIPERTRYARQKSSSPAVPTKTRREHGDTVMGLCALHDMCCCVGLACSVGMSLRMCTLPVFRKVNGLGGLT